MTTVHKTAKLKRRRKKMAAFESFAGGEGLDSGIRVSDQSKAPVAPGVFLQRLEKLRLAEIGPERGGDDQFRVGNLPQQKIADAHLAAGADEKVRVRIMTGVKVLRNQLLVDFRRLQLPFLDLLRHAADGLDYFCAGAVTERQNQSESVVLGQGGFGLGQLLLHEFRQAVNLADGVQPDVASVQFPDLALEKSGQVFHQRVHFLLGTVPILDGKGVERQ